MIRQIKEINPISSSSPQRFTAVGPWVYFAADDGSGAGSGNHELWRSDGSEAGTALVVEIPYPFASNPGLQARAAFQGHVYLSLSNGTYEPLWRSDGTGPGTVLINSGFPNVSVTGLTVAGDHLYASFGGGAPDSYLYRYDGTWLLPIRKPITAGGWWGLNPFEPTTLGANLYFTENFGNELWRTDGSTIAVQVADPGLPSADLPRSKRNLAAVGDTLFFAAGAGGGGSSRKELWKFKAGDPTTTRVAQIGTGYYPAELTAAGNRLFFVGDDSHGAELWMSDGTSAGTGLVRDINPTAGAGAPGPRRGPTNLTAVGTGSLYFAANDGSSGYELWRSDGTSAGTVRVLDINTGSASSHPLDLTPYGNLLYFTASDNSNGRQLWVTDTLTNTTSQLSSKGMLGDDSQFYVPLGYGGGDRNLSLAGETLFFSAYSRQSSTISGYELWGLDLPPLVSMWTSAVERRSEDGPGVVHVFFHRTGDTSSSLTVNVRVGGSASFGLDYEVREATSFSATAGTISFEAGSDTAILLLDPSSDALVEGTESINLALLSGAGYAVASSDEVAVFIVDGDSAAGATVGVPIPPILPGNTAFERRNNGAFAALKRDGSVITWGDAFSGGDRSAVASQLTNGVARIFSSSIAFAALKQDGSVVSWGFPTYGGDSSAVASQLASGVVQIASNFTAFAALKSDGSVVPWGDPFFGNFGSSAVSAQLASNVKQLFASRSAFAALKGDGSVVTWGDPLSGGDSAAVRSLLGAGVVEIIPGELAFAALKRDGSVVTWGDSSRGGSSGAAAPQLTSGVVRVFSNPYAFAAVKADGSVVSWGDASFGGDSSAVAPLLAGGVEQIAATVRSFAALKADGSVVTWGGDYGPPFFNLPDPAVAYQLSFGVERLYATNQVFAALKTDGSVVAWGHPLIGGDTSAVQAQLSSGVVDIVTSDDAFAALKSDGSVVTWGATATGGDSGAVRSQLASGVTRIVSTGNAFAALKSDGSVITWGYGPSGGDSSAVANALLSGVVALASPFGDDRLMPPPQVSLRVLEGSVVEDELGTLRFNVERSGGSSDALTVFFQLGSGPGAASYGSDFSQSGATPQPAPQPWSVQFADGSNTATVAFTPMADGDREVDETITISLEAHPSYRIGGSGTASGVILNDDIFSDDPANFRTIESRGNTALYRRLDGKGFAQVGAASRRVISSPWGGATELLGNWQMLAAEQVLGQNKVLWRNTDTRVVHVWTLDANWRWIASGGMDPWNTPAAGDLEETFQVDANGDGLIGSFRRLETQGNTTLLRRLDGLGFAQVGTGPPQQINSPWGSATELLGDWQMLAAETVLGQNKVLWRNNDTRVVHQWTLDANWNWIASGGMDPWNSPTAWGLEETFLVDANGDGQIGGFGVLETAGNTQLLRRLDGFGFAQTGSGARRQISSPWGSATEILGDWQMLAAENVLGQNKVLWRNTDTRVVHVWTLDSNWNWIASGSMDPWNTPAAGDLEDTFQVDANGDGVIGGFRTLEAQGNTKLLRRLDGLGFAQVGSGARQQINSPWGGATEILGNWQMLAAENVLGQNKVLWRNTETRVVHVWTLDSNWNWIASGSMDPWNTAAAGDLEDTFQVDANGDGVIGGFRTLESQGNTKLLRRIDGLGFAQVGPGARQQINSPWGGATEILGNWQMLAAENVLGQNKVLWRNTETRVVHVWTLDSNWNWIASGSMDPWNTPAAGDLEDTFQVDANGDGVIGGFQTLDAQGNSQLLRRIDGLGFVQVGAGPRQQINSPWGSATELLGDWQMLAAENVLGQNKVLWRNNDARVLHEWTMDSNWSWIASGGFAGLDSLAAMDLETTYDLDANRDGLTGQTISLDSQGNAALLRRNDGKAYVEVAGVRDAVISPFGLGSGDASSEWQMLAAENVGGQNQILLRNNPGNFLQVWNLNNAWSWQSSSSNIHPFSAAALGLEISFQVDANGDGVIG